MTGAIDLPSENLRRELWNARVESDMRRRYFSRMAQRAQSWDRGFRIALFSTSSTTAVTAVSGTELGPELFACATAILVAISFMLEFGSVTMKHTGFAVAWSRIHEETLTLWDKNERSSLSHNELSTALQELHRRIEPIDQQSIPHRVDINVLTECFEQAETYAFGG